jgi:hypothetical protein
MIAELSAHIDIEDSCPGKQDAVRVIINDIKICRSTNTSGEVYLLIK